MEAYTDFANVYDTFMDETPYDVWGDFVVELLNKYGVTKPVKNAGYRLMPSVHLSMLVQISPLVSRKL